MGGFYLVSRAAGADWLDLADRLAASFEEQGYTEREEVRTETYVLCVFGYMGGREQPPMLREVGGESEVIACSGTLLANGVSSTEALRFLGVNKEYRDYWGNYCLIRGDRTRVYVELDPLGLYKVYVRRNTTVLSSSFLAACAADRPLSVNDQGAYEYLIQGATYGSETVFNEIQILDPGCTVCIGGQRCGAGQPSRPTIAASASSFDECVEDVLDHLRKRFADLASASAGSIDTALSGGYDSRLILALLIDAGVNPRLHVYGGEQSRDVAVARSIADGEGLTLHHVNKSVKRGEVDPARVQANFLAMDGLSGDGIFNNGMDVATRRSRVRDGHFALNGGGGEIFRNFFYLADRSFTIREIVKAFYCQFDPSVFPTDRFVYKEYLDCLAGKIADCFAGDKSSLTRAEVEWIYPFFRCRFWMGRNNSLNTRFGPALTPLVDFELSLVACSIPMAFKKHGRFEAAMIKELSPQLARYQSEYGYNFSDPTPWSHRVSYFLNTHRPLYLRERAFRIKSGLSISSGESADTDEIVRRALPGGARRVSELCRTDRLRDAGQRQRAYSLEYLFRWMGV